MVRIKRLTITHKRILKIKSLQLQSFDKTTTTDCEEDCKMEESTANPYKHGKAEDSTGGWHGHCNYGDKRIALKCKKQSESAVHSRYKGCRINEFPETETHIFAEYRKTLEICNKKSIRRINDVISK